MDNIKKTIFLHIGFEKTGSSSIQAFCAANSNNLLSYNLCYLSDQENSLVRGDSHYPLVGILSDDIKNNLPFSKHINEKTARKLVLELASKTSADRILFSAEPFSSYVLSIDKIEKLKNIFDGFEIKIIAYLRRQDSFYLSHISQQLTSGVKLSRVDHLPETGSTLDYTYRDRYDYNCILERWEHVFERENMIIRPFETDSFIQGNLFIDFFNIFNINFTELKAEETKINTSPPIEGLLFLNTLNHLISDKLEKNIIPNIAIALSMLETQRPGQNFISNEHRNKIIDMYYNKNIALKEKYLTGKSNFFEAQRPNSAQIWSPILPLEQVEIHRIIRHLCETLPDAAEQIANIVFNPSPNATEEFQWARSILYSPFKFIMPELANKNEQTRINNIKIKLRYNNKKDKQRGTIASSQAGMEQHQGAIVNLGTGAGICGTLIKADMIGPHDYHEVFQFDEDTSSANQHAVQHIGCSPRTLGSEYILSVYAKAHPYGSGYIALATWGEKYVHFDLINGGVISCPHEYNAVSIQCRDSWWHLKVRSEATSNVSKFFLISSNGYSHMTEGNGAPQFYYCDIKLTIDKIHDSSE